MIRLSRGALDRAADWIGENARPLERGLYRRRFEGGAPGPVLAELARYQNPDGGFGRGLEPDFRLPASSPLATSVALRHLADLDDGGEPAATLITAAIGYLERSFIPARGGWLAVPREVNDHPHAPWWHWDPAAEMTVIDSHWGNPSAELADYLLRYGHLVRDLDVDRLLARAMEHLRGLEEFESEHEVYCYVRLHELMPPGPAARMRPELARAVGSVVCTDPRRWHEYVPEPLKLVSGPDSDRLGISGSLLDQNLDFRAQALEARGRVEPPWRWGSDEAVWEPVRREWTGVLTLEYLDILDRFGRIDR